MWPTSPARPSSTPSPTPSASPGLTAGAETDTQVLHRVKEAVGDTPVFVNTGVNPSNVREQLAIADGAVVGTYFKVDGVFENPSDRERTAELMEVVTALRRTL